MWKSIFLMKETVYGMSGREQSPPLSFLEKHILVKNQSFFINRLDNLTTVRYNEPNIC